MPGAAWPCCALMVGTDPFLLCPFLSEVKMKQDVSQSFVNSLGPCTFRTAAYMLASVVCMPASAVCMLPFIVTSFDTQLVRFL